MPLKTRCSGLGRCVCVCNVALPNQWALGWRGPEAAAGQAAAPEPRGELAGCALRARGSGESRGEGPSGSVCLRGGLGELGPSPPSAHAVASARAARPPRAVKGFSGQTAAPSAPPLLAGGPAARNAPARPEVIRSIGEGEGHGVALRGPRCRPAGRHSRGWRRAALPGARRLAGPLGRRRGGREDGSVARPVLCSPRRPGCPLTCSDRLGSAAACGAKAARAVLSEVLSSPSFICSFCTTGDVFIISRAKFWPRLAITCRGFGNI